MRTAVVSKPYYDEAGYDTYICDDDRRLYAIFDGMGVSKASRAASKGLKDAFEMTEVKSAEDIVQKLLGVVGVIRENRLDGGSTAVVVYIDEDENLHYASVGDSRLYIVNGGYNVRQVTRDEGLGNMLDNYIGYGNSGVHQFGVIEAGEWTKFMICSDGITGDWPEQFIDDKVENILGGNELPIIFCQRLIIESKKDDDKTVIAGIR